jgi:predicted DNA-binding transcriptional regulator AlpA
MDKLAYSVFEAVEATHIPRAVIYRYIADGRGPKFRKAGSRTIILKSDLLAWLETLPVVERKQA